MTFGITLSGSPEVAAKRLAAAVVGLAAAYSGISLLLNPDSLRTTALRFVAIAGTCVLAARGVRWARLLLVPLTGLVAVFAALVAILRPLPLGWRVVFLVYGLGTVWCIISLFREPANAYFAVDRKDQEGGA